jgi:enoyl-CoA hydratase/carnithine racemase
VTGGFERLRLTIDGRVARVVLARPEVRNAFDDALISELTRAFGVCAAEPAARVVVLSGDGPSFCAGADIHWMRRAGTYTQEENERDAERMARMLRAIDGCPKPVVVLAHGAAIGGGVGLVAAADIAIADRGVSFALTEVKLGLAPAAISLTVLPRLTSRAAAATMLTGERFDATRAAEMGLITTATDDLDGEVARVVAELASGTPQGLRETKRLLVRDLVARIDERGEDVAQLSARLFGSDEAREAMIAFLGRARS